MVVDVLLAFTTEAFAFSRGASSIVLASTVEEALELKGRFDGSLAMGEAGTLPVPEFDLSNSPIDILDRDLNGRRIIIVRATERRASIALATRRHCSSRAF